MEFVLSCAVLCLAASTAALAASVPFLFWKAFRLDARLGEEVRRLQEQIDTLDEAVVRLMEGIGVPAKEDGG